MFYWPLILLMLIVCSIDTQALKTNELVLLHTNDMHAHVIGVKKDDSMCSLKEQDRKDCFGGFDRIYTEVQKQRKLHGNVLVLDAGDQFVGSMFHIVYHGLLSARFMNRIGYDAMAVGNHEFDDGPKALADFAKTIKFPLLSANIDASQSDLLRERIKPYTIIEKNGISIGILGYTTKDTAYLSAPGPTVTFLPIIDSVKKAVLALKKAKVNVIIAVSHAGLKTDIDVASQVDGIAAIICGHSNSLLSNTKKGAAGPSPLVVRSPSNKPVLLVSAYAYGKYLGKLKFSFDQEGYPLAWDGEPILLDHRTVRNQTIKRQIIRYYKPIAQLEQEIVGVSPTYLDGQTCRFQECVLGNLVADVMLNYTASQGTQISFMNGGGLRASIPQGPINRAQIRNVMPSDKTLVVLKLYGSTIKKILEHGVFVAEDMKNDNTGRFLQVAGVKFSFDLAKPPGARIKDIKIIGTKEKIKPHQMYVVVTNSYLAEGGDNYTLFAQGQQRINIDIELKELLENYLKTPLAQLPKLDGRIRRLNGDTIPVF